VVRRGDPPRHRVYLDVDVVRDGNTPVPQCLREHADPSAQGFKSFLIKN
jgi:hypothetical protein